jgi:hypothetical protein
MRIRACLFGLITVRRLLPGVFVSGFRPGCLPCAFRRSGLCNLWHSGDGPPVGLPWAGLPRNDVPADHRQPNAASRRGDFDTVSHAREELIKTEFSVFSFQCSDKPWQSFQCSVFSVQINHKQMLNGSSGFFSEH